jgi:hypothetical protein
LSKQIIYGELNQERHEFSSICEQAEKGYVKMIALKEGNFK